MSVSLSQVAFWVIFPLAALIVLSGWVMILLSAVKKLRTSAKAAKAHEDQAGINPTRPSPDVNENLLLQDWDPMNIANPDPAGAALL